MVQMTKHDKHYRDAEYDRSASTQTVDKHGEKNHRATQLPDGGDGVDEELRLRISDVDAIEDFGEVITRQP